MEALENTDEESGTDASHDEVARLQEKLSTCQQQVSMIFSNPASSIHVWTLTQSTTLCLHILQRPARTDT